MDLLSSSARMGRRFSKLKALAALDSPLFFLLLAAAAAAELTAEKSTTDCPPAGSVHVSVASDPPCCLAARYSPKSYQSRSILKGDCSARNPDIHHPQSFLGLLLYLVTPGRGPAWRLLLSECSRVGRQRGLHCAIAVEGGPFIQKRE